MLRATSVTLHGRFLSALVPYPRRSSPDGSCLCPPSPFLVSSAVPHLPPIPPPAAPAAVPDSPRRTASGNPATPIRYGQPAAHPQSAGHRLSLLYMRDLSSSL